jgi:3'-5' exonuclease
MAIKFGANELIRDEHFLVLKKDIRQTKNGDDFMTLELSNKDGRIEAKIWNNNINQCQVEIGKVVEVSGKSQEYNGKISLVINSCQIVNSEEVDSYRDEVPTLVFDIECVGKKFEELDEKEQDYLLNNLEKATEDKEEAKKKTGLYSIFGKVCAIAGWDTGEGKGKVLVISDKDIEPENDKYEYIICKDEKELLEKWWKMGEDYERFVTYNGDNFDFPYLVIRSGVNRVKVPFEVRTWNNENRFLDLQKKIKQNNRGFKLEMLCKAFGLSNPKQDGVDGSEVANLYYNKEFKKIADYVARDVISTYDLYKLWKNFMSGEI